MRSLLKLSDSAGRTRSQSGFGRAREDLRALRRGAEPEAKVWRTSTEERVESSVLSFSRRDSRRVDWEDRWREAGREERERNEWSMLSVRCHVGFVLKFCLYNDVMW